MGRLTQVEWEELCETVFKEGDHMIGILAANYNVSRQSINAQLRKRGIRKRQERSDKEKRVISKKTYDQLAVLETTYRITSEDAIQDVLLSGNWRDEKTIHPYTLNRYMREVSVNETLG